MTKKLSLEYIKSYCSNIGITVLSNEYINNRIKLDLICSNGHNYQACFSHIQQGKRCPYCFNCKLLTIEYIKNYCLEKDLIVNSDNYINNHSKLNFTCKNGHNFDTTFNSIQHGTKCPYCSGVNKPNIEKFKQIAISKNAICLSDIYISARSKLKILCKNCNYEFYITPNNINNGKWCPNCVTSLSERYCRLVFESIFKCKFDKIRPKWLINPKTNYPLELDGYNSDLKLAFEHNGFYHYNKIYDGLVQYRDNVKKELCNKYGINLIIIPELFKIVKLYELEEYIKNECSKLNIFIPEYDTIDYSKVYF